MEMKKEKQNFKIMKKSTNPSNKNGSHTQNYRPVRLAYQPPANSTFL
jgi:hypothetical protein